MEELQDAIEDAQYVNAIATQEDGPRPVLRWEIPSEEQLHKWENTIRKKQDGVLWDIDSTLSSAIGFFMFSSYVKEKESDYCRMNFCEDVLRFRKLRGAPRLEKMHTMLRLYLTDPPKVDQETGETRLPPRSDIDEYDLERNACDLRLNQEQFQSFFKMSIDFPTCSESFVGLKGPAREELFHKLRELEDTLENTRKSELVRYASADMERASPLSSANSPRATLKEEVVLQHAVSEPDLLHDPDPSESSEQTRESKASQMRDAQKEYRSMYAMQTGSLRGLTARLRSTSAHRLSADVFDMAEAVVMESLRRDYWQAFMESQEFARLKNFLWFQDRRVVPEDFFVMRVLGRGGFGLVTGMLSSSLSLL